MAERLRVVLRARARNDIEQAVDWYRDHSDATTALAFVDAVESAFGHVSSHPEAGSPRYATELDLPGLRSLLLHGFPYLVFYVVGEGMVDVWRVLHAQRDIAARLGPPTSGGRSSR